MELDHWKNGLSSNNYICSSLTFFFNLIITIMVRLVVVYLKITMSIWAQNVAAHVRQTCVGTAIIELAALILHSLCCASAMPKLDSPRE